MYKKYEDENCWCIDCGRSFIFTGLEKEFYELRGYDNYPKRCVSCREKKTGKPALELYEAKCYKCKKRTLISFKPVNPDTIRCENCFLSFRSRYK